MEPFFYGCTMGRGGGLWGCARVSAGGGVKAALT